MAEIILEVIKDADLIKFFAIVGSIFFFFGVVGRIWGVKEPMSRSSKWILSIVGIIMLLGAALGFVDNKNQLISNKIISEQKEQIRQAEATKTVSNQQNVKGDNNKTVGNVTGDNNQVVQGNNNKLNSDNKTIIKSSYKEGDYIVYFSYNTETKDTTILKRVKQQNEPVKPVSKEKSDVCSLNNKTYYMMTMRPHYFVKFYDQNGDTYKFVAHINAYDYNGTAKFTGKEIVFFGNNSTKGEASLSNGCKYLTGFLGSHTMNFTL
ncbi:hypothetical protein [Phaeodactylibacter sp.]|uniref:hypothetical protein n=1 Tax=Phaeodactylibacter sp. TaxID=1940289 RepID=UPI0025F89AB5|nr:hypothetical protein [Phaeodactylibacter sp.]MCI5056713.1 hypothetical protein [Flavobacteriales bacterium]MCI5093494.1 hypothetical protein [Phaeodactylibacter sp.]